MLSRLLRLLPFAVLSLLVVVALCRSTWADGAQDHRQYLPEVYKPFPRGINELNILWAQWDPADYLEEIGKIYEAEFGIRVNVIKEPWGSFADRFFTELEAGNSSFDMVVGDSQWLGTSVINGYYFELTDIMISSGITDTVTSASLTNYGEYPVGSGRYWAYPTEGDAIGWAYRKDLFEDPDEMADFEDQYGYPLAPPETYEQLMDIAKFFTRPDDGVYGVAIYTDVNYNGLTSGVENMLFSWGGNWHDENNNVLGVINSSEAVEAVQFYRDLHDCCRVPGLSNVFFTEVNDAFTDGQAAMIMNYFDFFPALVNHESNPYSENTGFFVNPAGPYGDQYAVMGGQALSIINLIDDDRKEVAIDFLRWFARQNVQTEWAALGGNTCNVAILDSPIFEALAPYNPAYAESMTFVKDFWRVPEYVELFAVAQDELSQFIVAGEGTAQATMDNIAQRHHEILRSEPLP